MYWRIQGLIDPLAVLVISEALWFWSDNGGPKVIDVGYIDIIALTRTWVGPLVTLIGMMSATTAFLFSVIDRQEFSILKDSGSQRYLWQVFSQNLFWLLCAAIAACVTSLLSKPPSLWWTHFLGYLVVIVFVCLAKFVWVMRQIISVRVSQASKS